MLLIENKTYINDIEKALKASKIDFSCFNNKKVLITGGLGLIGSAIVDVLLQVALKQELDIKIYIADINKSVFDIKYSGCKNVFFIYYDATKTYDFEDDFAFVVNCAGIANPNLYVSKPVETTLSNVNGISNVLNIGIRNKDAKIVTTSSSEVYGTKTVVDPFVENKYGVVDFDNIRSSYAVGKIVMESLCRSYASEYGVNIACVRPGHIFGPGASKNDTRVSSAFCCLAAENKPLKLYSDGSQERSYLYSIDCAIAILYVLLFGKSGEAYNVGHKDITSVRTLCNYISDYAKVSLEIGERDTTVASSNPMDYCALDSNKLFNLGFAPTFGVKEAIEHTISIIKEMENN